MRSDAEITAEINKLRALIPRIPDKNAFGDSNHELIKASILTLEKRLDTDDALADQFLIDEEDEEYEGQSDRSFEIEGEARDAMNWMLGIVGSAPPSEGWTRLAAVGRKS